MSGSAVVAEVQTTYAYETAGAVRRARLAAQATRLCVGPSGDHLSCTSSALLGSNAYEYDKNDSISKVTEDNGSGAVTHYYCYGGRGELLTRRTGADCASATADEAYAYDATGNITAATGGGLQVSYTYTQSSPSAPVSVVTLALTVYSDSAGLTTKVAGGASGDWAYLYDAEGRLASACRSSSCSGTGFDRADYAYDGAGHRTRITTTLAGVASVRNIAYSGDAPAQETDGSGAVLRTYVTDGTGRITRFCDPDCTGSSPQYLVAYSAHGDALSVSEVDPATGAATAANRYAYQTWGRPATATANGYPDLGFRYLWVGASDVQWDDAAGEALYYMHARSYSPALGRFLQPDPARADGSLYAYAGNSPVTKSDPSGRILPIAVIVMAAPAIGSAALELAGYLAFIAMGIGGGIVVGNTFLRRNGTAVRLPRGVQHLSSMCAMSFAGCRTSLTLRHEPRLVWAPTIEPEITENGARWPLTGGGGGGKPFCFRSTPRLILCRIGVGFVVVTYVGSQLMGADPWDEAVFNARRSPR